MVKISWKHTIDQIRRKLDKLDAITDEIDYKILELEANIEDKLEEG